MTYHSVICIPTLRCEIESLKSWRDDSGALMMVKPSSGIPQEIKACPAIMKAIWEIGSLRGQDPLHVMINVLPGITEVHAHRDYILPTKYQPDKPCVERWHLPIQTNDMCFFWDEISDREVHYPVGVWSGPVPYWAKHYVVNHSFENRIHLVVDLDTPTPVGRYTDG